MRHIPRLGISACLLGEKVRYDGGHKYEQDLIEALSGRVRFVPVCPEVEMGLEVPRQPMRLEYHAGSTRLIVIATGDDLTEAMELWSVRRLRELGASDLCGFIFKSRSPSCGIRGVEVHQAGREPEPGGTGIWARVFMRANPGTPVADELKLRDAGALEEFIAGWL